MLGYAIMSIKKTEPISLVIFYILFYRMYLLLSTQWIIEY